MKDPFFLQRLLLHIKIVSAYLRLPPHHLNYHLPIPETIPRELGFFCLKDLVYEFLLSGIQLAPSQSIKSHIEEISNYFEHILCSSRRPRR